MDLSGKLRRVAQSVTGVVTVVRWALGDEAGSRGLDGRPGERFVGSLSSPAARVAAVVERDHDGCAFLLDLVGTEGALRAAEVRHGALELRERGFATIELAVDEDGDAAETMIRLDLTAEIPEV